jgi:hypothetical protein
VGKCQNVKASLNLVIILEGTIIHERNQEEKKQKKNANKIFDSLNKSSFSSTFTFNSDSVHVSEIFKKKKDMRSFLLEDSTKKTYKCTNVYQCTYTHTLFTHTHFIYLQQQRKKNNKHRKKKTSKKKTY